MNINRLSRIDFQSESLTKGHRPSNLEQREVKKRKRALELKLPMGMKVPKVFRYRVKMVRSQGGQEGKN